MERPRITIYKINGQFVYNCNMANEIYKEKLIHIKAIFHVLTIAWLCEKDDYGQYINTPGYQKRPQP